MFRFLHSPGRKRRAPRPRSTYRTLRMEALQSRYCPSGPSITAFQIDSVVGSEVTLSGSVAASETELERIEIWGAVNGDGWPNASGNFTIVSYADGPGTIWARAYDAEGIFSAAVSVELQTAAPEIVGLSISYGGRTEITISGQVVDEDPRFASIHFYGALEECVAPDANGYFSVTTTYASLGTLYVWAEDALYVSSATVTKEIASNAPMILNFGVTVTAGNTLVVEGNVADEDPAGLWVTLSWLDDEYSVKVDSSGYFVWMIAIEDGQQGWVGAWTEDWWGLESDYVADLVMS